VEILIRSGRGPYFDLNSGLVYLLTRWNGAELESGIDTGAEQSLVNVEYEVTQVPVSLSNVGPDETMCQFPVFCLLALD
jgi:hypothetical protein